MDTLNVLESFPDKHQTIRCVDAALVYTVTFCIVPIASKEV